MRYIGFLLLFTLALLAAGCGPEKRVTSSSVPRDSGVSSIQVSGSPSEPAPPEEDDTKRTQAAGENIIKTEMPVADPEAELVLRDLDKEIEGLLQALQGCEDLADEDLEFEGVEQ